VLPGLRTLAYAEVEAFAVELLLARMEGGQLDAAPIWSDLKSFPWGAFSGMVDILSGGYPCQPFSAAGRRAGADDPRHLWPYIAAGIRVLRPRMCFFENVEGHITLGLSSVISDLEEMGYAVSWGIFSAAECGAPHQRKRVFILAESISSGLERHAWDGANGTESGWVQKDPAGPVAKGCLWPSGPSQRQYGWEPNRTIESKLGGDTDGPPGGVDRLRLLGNGVVPATAELAFRTLTAPDRCKKPGNQ
jgi:DNA (cytosine-5)-methyltransferase 1